MKAIFFEWKKAAGTRRFTAFLLLCLAACGILAFVEARRDDSYF